MTSCIDREGDRGDVSTPRSSAETAYDALLSIDSLCARLDCSPSWVKAEVRAGRFPEPIRMGVRFTRWKESDVERYLAALVPEAGKKAAAYNQVRARKASDAARLARVGWAKRDDRNGR